MASKMNVAYVEKDSTEDHLRAIRSDGVITADMVDINVKSKSMFRQSSSRYGGIRSAINHVYILEIVQIPERMKRELYKFMVEMERTLIAEKQMMSLKIPEEKKPSASIHMSSLRRHYLKAEKIGIFLNIYS